MCWHLLAFPINEDSDAKNRIKGKLIKNPAAGEKFSIETYETIKKTVVLDKRER